MPQSGLRLAPGTLWPAVLRQTARALACGALQPIETVQELVVDAGVSFLVRIASSLRRKAEERSRRDDDRAGANPFLPFDPDLFVAEVSDTHLALLNKFNVIDHHLLIVTRSFVDQEVLLDRRDFEALAACMAEFEGMAFYNAGRVAGASQPHKHLQMVPLPLAEGGPPVPIEPLFDAAGFDGAIGRVPGLPFAHAFTRFEFPPDPLAAAQTLHERYSTLLEAVGVHGIEVEGETRQSAPYNLLATRRWMLLVPRSQECFEGVSVNALGYAGSLFVRDEAQVRMVKQHGPMAVLKAVSVS